MPIGETETFNPCYRVYMALREAQQEDSNIPALAAWTNALGVRDTEFLDERFDTIHMLGLLTHEKDLAWLQVSQQTSISASIYQPTFNKASQAMNLGAISQLWGESKQHITSTVLRELKAYSAEMPADQRVDEETLRRLKEEVEEFANRVRTHVEDEHLKIFLLEQLTILRKAFLEYSLTGVAAFRRASGQLIAEFQNPANRKVLDDHRDTDEMRRLSELWNWSLKLYATIEMVKGVVQTLEVQQALEVASSLLQLGG